MSRSNRPILGMPYKIKWRCGPNRETLADAELDLQISGCNSVLFITLVDYPLLTVRMRFESVVYEDDCKATIYGRDNHGHIIVKWRFDSMTGTLIYGRSSFV